MNKIAVGALAAAAVATAAVGYGTLVYPSQRARAELDRTIAGFSPDTKASYGSVGYSLFSGTMTITGLEMALRDGEDRLNVHMDNLTLRGLGKNRIGEARGTGITMEDGGKTTRVAAERLDGENLEIDDQPVKDVPASNQPSRVTLKRVALTGVTLVTGGDTSHLREVVLADLRQIGKTPSAVTVGVHGIEVETAKLAEPEARETLAQLGYERLVLELDLSYDHDAEAQRLTVRNISIGGNDVGRLALSASFGGVAAIPGDDTADVLGMMRAATLDHLELRYDDASLAPRLFRLAARANGVEEPAWKDDMAAQINNGLGVAEISPLTRDILNSAAAFLAEPKSLALRMDPPKPLPVMMLPMAAQDLNTLIQAAGLTVFANR